MISNAIVAASVLLSASAVPRQEPAIYPAEGQSLEQLEKDAAECRQWARGSAGEALETSVQASAGSLSVMAEQVKTLASAVGVSPQRSGPSAPPALLGAARAAGLAARTDGDVGEAAAIGAVQSRRQSRRRRAAAEEQQARAAQLQELVDALNDQLIATQAMLVEQSAALAASKTACLEGRGYTVQRPGS